MPNRGQKRMGNIERDIRASGPDRRYYAHGVGYSRLQHWCRHLRIELSESTRGILRGRLAGNPAFWNWPSTLLVTTMEAWDIPSAHRRKIAKRLCGTVSRESCSWCPQKPLASDRCSATFDNPP